MSIIASVQGALGDHKYSQKEITETFSKIVSPKGEHSEAIKRIHTATKVNFRGLALPAVAYEEMGNFGDRNDAFIDIALKLSAKVVTSALGSGTWILQMIDHRNQILHVEIIIESRRVVL